MNSLISMFYETLWTHSENKMKSFTANWEMVILIIFQQVSLKNIASSTVQDLIFCIKALWGGSFVKYWVKFVGYFYWRLGCKGPLIAFNALIFTL